MKYELEHNDVKKAVQDYLRNNSAAMLNGLSEVLFDRREAGVALTAYWGEDVLRLALRAYLLARNVRVEDYPSNFTFLIDDSGHLEVVVKNAELLSEEEARALRPAPAAPAAEAPARRPVVVSPMAPAPAPAAPRVVQRQAPARNDVRVPVPPPARYQSAPKHRLLDPELQARMPMFAQPQVFEGLGAVPTREVAVVAEAPPAPQEKVAAPVLVGAAAEQQEMTPEEAKAFQEIIQRSQALREAGPQIQRGEGSGTDELDTVSEYLDDLPPQ